MRRRIFFIVLLIYAVLLGCLAMEFISDRLVVGAVYDVACPETISASFAQAPTPYTIKANQSFKDLEPFKLQKYKPKPELPLQRIHAKPPVEPIWEHEEPSYGTGRFGDEGRFVIPEAGFAVPVWNCYQADGYFDYAQSVIDQYDAAAMFWVYTDTPFISDHVNQGFSVINNCYPGQLSYVEKNGYKTWYECEYVEYNAVCYMTEIITPSGIDPTYAGADHLVNYTCNGYHNGDEFGITLVVWRQTTVSENPFWIWSCYYPTNHEYSNYRI